MSTPVVFRVFRKGGDVIALFPTLPENPGLVTSYMHIGQHSAASWGLVVDRLTRPARPDEYAALARELRQIGYRLKVYRRRPPRH